MTKSNNSIASLEQDFDLIHGTFSTDKAQEIVNQLISNEINFLKLQSFSQQVRYGTADEAALEKAERLAQEKRRVEELIRMASQTGTSVTVQSKIIVTVS